MRKKLIKKGEGGFALLSSQLMQNAGMNFYQEKPKYNFKTGSGVLKAPELDTAGLAMNGMNGMNLWEEEYNPFNFQKGTGMLNSYKKLSDPVKINQPNFAKAMPGPDISKITAQGISKLNAASAPTTKQVNGAKWNNFKKGAGDFLKSDIGMQVIGQGAEAIGNFLPNTNDDKISQGIDTGLKTVAKLGFSKEAMAATGGASAIVGGAIYGADALNKGLGALTNGATSLENSTNLFDSASGSMLGVINPIMLANNLTKKKVAGTSDYASSQAQSSSYSDSGRIGKAEIGGVSNLFSNVFGRDLVAERKYKVNKINSENISKIGVIKDTKQQLAARNQAIGNTKTNIENQLSGRVLTAKNGATLEDIRNYIKVRNIEKEVAQNPNLDDNLEKIEVSKFQNGGSLIPSGALHKNKHNLESVNSDLKGEITNKGIPVISYAEKGDILEYEKDGKTPKVLAEGGEIIQHAEIEKDEIILNLSLTKKLVELMKKDTSEAMIEAGKILARELMENTTDNTGLIEKTIGNED